jgi:hypothetical protein
MTLIVKILIKLEANSILFPLAVPIFDRKLESVKFLFASKIIEINEIICTTVIISVTYSLSKSIWSDRPFKTSFTDSLS